MHSAVLILRSKAGEYALLATVLTAVCALSIVPMLRLLYEGIAPGGALSTDVLSEVLAADSTWRALWRSCLTAFGGTLISLLIGVPFAALVALTDLRRKTALVFLFMLPLMIPPQITALSWIQLFGPSSELLKLFDLAPPLGTPHPLFSPEGIMLLLGVQHAPLVFLSLRAGLRGLPREMVEAARSAGASPMQVLRTIVLPLMTPPLVAGGALAFVSALGNFGIPAMLGIPVSYSTMPVLIYQRLSGFGPDIISEVAILSLVIGVVAGLGVLAQGWLLSRRDFRTIGGASRTLALPLGRLRGLAEATCWLLLLVVLVAPLSALVATSLVPSYGVPLTLESATLEAYREVVLQQSATRRAMVNSLGLSLGAAFTLVLLTVPLAYFLTWRRSKLMSAVNVLAELPYALPGVVLSIACILVFIHPLPLLGIALYGTPWIIFVAYLARFLTLALKPVVAGFTQLDQHLEEAAQIAGASLLFRLRTIIAPLLAPVAVAGAVLVFMTAFNEITVSALLWSSGSETLGVLVFNLDDGGYTGMATALAVLIVAAIVLLMSGAQLFARRLPAGVLPWQG